MAVLNTGQSFSSGDQVTADKLMDIANDARFITGANQTADDLTIQVDGSGGYLKVKSGGISSNELATDSVITAKIQDEAVTAPKLAQSAISVLMPTGTILPYAGLNAPGSTSPISDYLICDGRSVNTYDYRELHSIISNTYDSSGTAYNPGTTDQVGATTTFVIPDLRGRVIAGLDVNQGGRSNRLTSISAANIDGQTLGANNGNPGDTGRGTNGAQEHILTESEIPNHNHATQTITRVSYDATGGSLGYGHDTPSGTGPDVQTDFTGGDQAHNNVQPTIILNYIIKT